MGVGGESVRCFALDEGDSREELDAAPGMAAFMNVTAVVSARLVMISLAMNFWCFMMDGRETTSASSVTSLEQRPRRGPGH